GGEDMRLLEVDEAANHIRELVDEDANIIWGSAFNPDLKGKIRVSVVATGIEQGAISAVDRSQSVSLGQSRAPKRPVLELSEDEGMSELPPEAEDTPVAAPAPVYTPPVAAAVAPTIPAFELTPPDVTTSVSYDDDALDLADDMEEIEEVEDELPAAKPFSLSGMQSGDEYSNEYEDDVDGIVDPLAGLRGNDEAGFGFTAPPAAEPEPLDLDDGYAAYTDAEDEAEADEGPAQDDLLANADRLAAENRPVEPRLGGTRRRGLLGGEGDEGGAPAGGGSTLFERMANLSRSTARDDDDDGDGGDDGPALSIPRFLGRQNNQ
ncbi:MAG: cell division protein FtsZ, partial [Erythrobacter sp.]|nr:cell division protein FtsZ [Erythrobacter sp.]